MNEKTFNIFKIEYSLYEGEYSEIFLGKTINIKDFEADLIKAKKFAKSLMGKKYYCVDCLPEFYQQIIDFLINKLEYIECSLNEELS